MLILLIKEVIIPYYDFVIYALNTLYTDTSVAKMSFSEKNSS